MTKRFLAVAATFLLFLAMLPLSVGNAQTRTNPLVPTTARFRVVIAANLATSVDVWVDGVISIDSGPLKSVKPLSDSGYITAAGGSHTITLYQTGTTTAVGTPFTANYTVGSSTTVALLSDMTWMSLPDVATAPPALQASARLVNLSAFSNPVSLSVDGVVPAAFTSVAYKSASASYAAYPVGLHTLAVPGSTQKPISYNFQDGKVYSFFVYWNPSTNQTKVGIGTDASFIMATPTPTGTLAASTPTGPAPSPTVGAPRGNTNATFRVVNASPAGPGLDILVDNSPTTLINVAFTKASTYIPISGSAAPGTAHTISVVQTGTTSPVLASFTANFVSQVDQTLVYFPGAASLVALLDNNANPTVGGTTSVDQVRFVNLSLDNPAVDLWVDGKLVSGYAKIADQAQSVYLPQSLAAHTFELHLAGSATPLIPAMTATLLPSRVYSVFVFGSAGSVPPTLQLVDKADARFPIELFLPAVMR